MVAFTLKEVGYFLFLFLFPPNGRERAMARAFFGPRWT